MWVSTQRRNYHKKTWIPGKGMREDRKLKLESIGFEWTRSQTKKKSLPSEQVEVEEPPTKKLKTEQEEEKVVMMQGEPMMDTTSTATVVAAAVEEAAKQVEHLVQAAATASTTNTTDPGDAAVQAAIQDVKNTVNV